MKTFFETPVIDVQKFSALEDILTASGNTDPDENAGEEMPF